MGAWNNRKADIRCDIASNYIIRTRVTAKKRYTEYNHDYWQQEARHNAKTYDQKDSPIKQNPFLDFLYVNRVFPRYKRLDGRKLRMTSDVFPSKKFVGISAGTSLRSSTLRWHSDASIIAFGFRMIRSEIRKCLFEDLPVRTVGGSSIIGKRVQLRPCSLDKTRKVRQEGPPIIWNVFVDLRVIVIQIDCLILA